MNRDKLAPCIRHLCDRVPVVAIYLFGSQAAGTAHSGSDYDIGLLYDYLAPLDPLKRFELQEELSEITHTDVDLVFLNDVGPVIAMQIATKGRVIYENERQQREHNEFLMHLYSRYAEFKELIAPLEGQIHERWSTDG